MIQSDCHMHTDFSGDSKTSMEEMVKKGIQMGLTVMCFTEHLDLEMPEETTLDFVPDLDAYWESYQRIERQYRGEITLLFGIELGLAPHLAEKYERIIKKYPFDFVIGSTHLVGGRDPYEGLCFQEKEEEELYRQYFRETAENLETFPQADACGHADYIVRYGPEKSKNYSYEKYREELNKVLRVLVEKQIALEINTAGYKYGLGEPNPAVSVIKRYKEMGGEMVTLGSDAHEPCYLAYDFWRAQEILKECGFRYYTVFRGRTPFFIPL